MKRKGLTVKAHKWQLIASLALLTLLASDASAVAQPAKTQISANDPIYKARLLYGQRRFKDSVAVMDVAIKGGDHRWQAYFQRAMAYKALKRADEALKDLDEAARLNPKDSEPLIQHADIDMSIMEDERAIEYLSRALKVDANNTAILLTRATIYENLSNYAAAVKDFETYLKCHPDRADSDFCRNAGHAYYQNHNPAKAVEFLSRSLALNPKVHKVHLYRGDAYLELKNYKAAIADYTASLADVQDPSVYEKRARCYDGLGDKSAAAKDRAAIKNIGADAFLEAPFRTKSAR